MNVNNKWHSFQYVSMDISVQQHWICSHPRHECWVLNGECGHVVEWWSAARDHVTRSLTSVEWWVQSRGRVVISCSWSRDSISQLSSSSSMASSKQWVSSLLSYCRFMFLAILAKQFIHKHAQRCVVVLRMRGALCLTCSVFLSEVWGFCLCTVAIVRWKLAKYVWRS